MADKLRNGNQDAKSGAVGDWDEAAEQLKRVKGAKKKREIIAFLRSNNAPVSIVRGVANAPLSEFGTDYLKNLARSLRRRGQPTR